MKSFPIRWGDIGAELPVDLRDELGTVLTGAHLQSAVLKVAKGSGKVELSLAAPGASVKFPNSWIHVFTSGDFSNLPAGRYVCEAYGVKVGGTEMRTLPTESDLELRIRKIIP